MNESLYITIAIINQVLKMLIVMVILISKYCNHKMLIKSMINNTWIIVIILMTKLKISKIIEQTIIEWMEEKFKSLIVAAL